VPVDVAKLMGSDFVVAVSVSGDFSRNKISNMFMVLNQSINIQGRVMDENSLAKADLVIRPHVGDVSTVDLGQSRECIDRGY